jgi:hypothetical protein
MASAWSLNLHVTVISIGQRSDESAFQAETDKLKRFVLSVE